LVLGVLLFWDMVRVRVRVRVRIRVGVSVRRLE
jgi:hypothetical protein